jgi:hypothetical protein
LYIIYFDIYFTKISISGSRLLDIREDLTSMFQEVIDTAAQQYSKQDKARLTIAHDDLPDEVFVHLQDLSNLSGETVMNRFTKVLNSHKDMCVDNSFKISVGLLKTHKGGAGKRLSLLPHLNETIFSSVFNKRSIVEIIGSEKENEKVCAAMSIIVCMAKIEGMKRTDYLNLINKNRQGKSGKQSLRSRAIRLQQQTQLRIDTPVLVNQLSEFEKILKVKICVVQFLDNSHEATLSQCSDTKYEKTIFLYLDSQEHFHAIVNPAALLPKQKICQKCYKIVPFKSHICLNGLEEKKCFPCQRFDCKKGQLVKCNDCNFTCFGKSCFEAHKAPPPQTSQHNDDQLSLCQKRYKCTQCEKVIDLQKQKIEEHICGQYHCSLCSKNVDLDHLCFLRRKKTKITNGKFLYFDLETTQDSVFMCEKGYAQKGRGENCDRCTNEYTCASCRLCQNCKKPNCGRTYHQPNLAVCQSSCDNCKSEKLLPGAICRLCGDICADCFILRKAHNFDKMTECKRENCGAREVIFRGFNTLDSFCEWLISPVHKDTTVLAHNSKAFDSCFILNFCVNNARIKPDVVFAGSKIMSLKINEGLNIQFIDSLNFMPVALKKLPSAFGLQIESEFDDINITEITKGDFPHKMNTRENQNYIGEWPSLQMYGVDFMSDANREKFIQWHSEQQGKIFDLQAELEAYCKVDVSILRMACIKFRDLIMEITKQVDVDGEILGQVDPFAQITIASTCMQIFRVNFIEEYYYVTLSDGRAGSAVFKSGIWKLNGDNFSPEDIVEKEYQSSNIAQIPSVGYIRNTNHSAASIAWIEWIAKKYNITISHARNNGEKTIKCGPHNYIADGYYDRDILYSDHSQNSQNSQKYKATVFEYNGCRFHGCPCLQMMSVFDPKSHHTMNELNKLTKKKKSDLESAGYRVISIYECEFNAQVKDDPDLRNFVNSLDIPKRMKIRDSFYGGRTSGFKLHYKVAADEEILYLDVCSLYPFINKVAKMPVGHPEIINKNFDPHFKNYFGFAHVKILPPHNLYIPVLPVRVDGKLMFPLCTHCAINCNQGDCTHSDDERCITGVWCTPEIIAALEAGYKLVKIYEVYHYAHTSQYDAEKKTGGLFSDQVNLFVKLKTEASGYPDNVTTEDEKEAYIHEVYEKVGVELEKDKIKTNPALRSISKICCNSFWGKLAERNNKPQVVYISSTEVLAQFTNNSINEIVNFHIVNEDVLVLEYRKCETFEKENFTTNIALASFTTCWARLELLKYLQQVNTNLLYCDTDSIIFVTKKNSDGSYQNCPKVGSCLGELTNELKPGQHITEFVCTGPKSYSFRTNDGVEAVKFKGVSLTFKNSQRINFESVRELVFGPVSSISLFPHNQFKRMKYDGVIYNADIIKKLKVTFNKRKILNNFDTHPFGFKKE